MLHSSCSLFGDTWDTNRACQFLKISDEELLLLNSIPGWEKEPDEKQTSESENSLVTEIPPQISIPVNAATKQSNNVIENPNIGRKILVPNSDSSPEISRITPPTDKDNFMRNISLSFNKTDNVSSLPDKQSYSALNNDSLKANQSTSSSNSETNLMKVAHNTTEQFVSDKCSAKKIKPTKLIQDPLEDKTNNNQAFTDIHCNKNLEILSKKEASENLEAILNHPYFNKTLSIESKSKTNDIPPNSEKINLCRENLKKKLELLQKRFSQSRKCDLLSPFEESIKNNNDFESVGSEKQFPEGSEITEKISGTQSGEMCLSNLSNNNKEINLSTDSNSSTNATILSSNDIQSPGETKQSESDPTATQSENEAVVKLFPNVPKQKNCTSQQSKPNPVVIHLSKSGNIPPSADSHSFPQQNSINQPELNSKDAENNVSAPCVIMLSTDTHSFAHPNSINQSATVKSKDVDKCEPVPCGISSSPDGICFGQSFKSHPGALLKSNEANVCVSVPSDIPQSIPSPSRISSSQFTALSHSPISKMRSPLKLKSPVRCVVSATDSQTLVGSNVVDQPAVTSSAEDNNSMKVIEGEKEATTFSVFSDSPSGLVSPKTSVSGEVVKSSGKRKRESQGDHKPHKKLSLSNTPVDIQYTSEQVRNMIEILRFQFKM